MSRSNNQQASRKKQVRAEKHGACVIVLGVIIYGQKNIVSWVLHATYSWKNNTGLISLHMVTSVLHVETGTPPFQLHVILTSESRC